MNSYRKIASMSVVAGLLTFSGQAMSEEPATGRSQGVEQEIQLLKERIAQLEQKESTNWLSAERTNAIRAIVDQAVADARKRELADAPMMGYSNGFYIQTADKKFKLNINGFIQARYTFADDEVRNSEEFVSQPKSGNVNGFDFRRARVSFNGNAFSTDLTYCLTLDFAGDAADKNPLSSVTTNGSGNVTGTSQTMIPTDKNYAQIVDAYVAYRFNDWLNVRIGSFLTPFSRAEYVVGGAQLVDVPAILSPFDPVRSMGLSLYGQPIKDQLSYEINLNNGQCSNTFGRAGEVSTSTTTASNGGNNDNRMAYYMRLQYAGAGKLSDFNDEPDLRKDKANLAWMVGGAFGYESANTTNKAFPSPQGGVTIPVSSTTTPGFVSYPLNGDVFRGTVDFSTKYQGFAFTGAGYFQQINANAAVDGSTAPTVPAGYAVGTKSSFFQAGYYGQAGYMLTKELEVVGRVGQFMTEGNSRTMEEYALGLNYYVYGQNLKIQADVNYIPRAAATSSVLGTAVNTQDVVFRLQVQLKF